MTEGIIAGAIFLLGLAFYSGGVVQRIRNGNTSNAKQSQSSAVDHSRLMTMERAQGGFMTTKLCEAYRDKQAANLETLDVKIDLLLLHFGIDGGSRK